MSALRQGRRRRLALLATAVAISAATAVHSAAAQGGTKSYAEKFDSVKADLSQLGALEKAYYAQHRQFTVDTAVLKFRPRSGARISISYASTRAWAASATHPMLHPFVCFLMVTSATADSWPEQPFCRDSRRGTATSAIVKAGAATDAATPPKKPEPRPPPA